jgi:hypothetical protein
MTELEMFQNLFSLVGCGYSQGKNYWHSGNKAKDDESGFSMIFNAGQHEKVQGYIGFEASLHFDSHGKFLGMAIYE